MPPYVLSRMGLLLVCCLGHLLDTGTQRTDTQGTRALYHDRAALADRNSGSCKQQSMVADTENQGECAQEARVTNPLDTCHFCLPQLKKQLHCRLEKQFGEGSLPGHEDMQRMFAQPHHKLLKEGGPKSAFEGQPPAFPIMPITAPTTAKSLKGTIAALRDSAATAR